MTDAPTTVRNEQQGDHDGVRQVHLASFDDAGEARLVDLLRQRGKAVVSLVAETGGDIVGHVMFSPIIFEPPREQGLALGLAPLAVLPDWQRRGVGSQLVRAGLDACRSAGCAVVIVLGHPDYYTRFGFIPASRFGVANEYGVDEPFMMLELSPGDWSDGAHLARYAEEFTEAELS